MKTISILYFVLFNLSIFSCAQEKTINKDSQKMFTEFTQKDKFNKDESLFYPGLEDKNIQSNLTKEINKLAKTFESIQSSKNPSSDFYLKAIESSLKTDFSIIMFMVLIQQKNNFKIKRQSNERLPF